MNYQSFFKYVYHYGHAAVNSNPQKTLCGNEISIYTKIGGSYTGTKGSYKEGIEATTGNVVCKDCTCILAMEGAHA